MQLSRLGKVREVAKQWHARSEGYSLLAIPAWLGIPVLRIEQPAATILGLSVELEGVRSISYNSVLEGTNLHGLVLAHEVSHFLIGLCEGGVATCEPSSDSHECETLAWYGAALFRYAHPNDEAVVRGFERGGLDGSLALLRLTLGYELGEIDRPLQFDTQLATRFVLSAVQLEAARIRLDAITENPLTSRIA